MSQSTIDKQLGEKRSTVETFIKKLNTYKITDNLPQPGAHARSKVMGYKSP